MVCGDKLEVPSSMAGPGELIEKQETVSKSQSSRVPVPKQVAQVARHDARVEQLDDGRCRHAPGHLVLPDGRAAGDDGVVGHLLERAWPDHPDLQRADGAGPHPSLAVRVAHTT